ncbi:MAG TPA: Amuc_1100 family pilus-like protein [Verrucomicrobiae bacterium]|nr:Amuc_1100 family pilus-like protein [Verrucomicrobiae bacterium]
MLWIKRNLFLTIGGVVALGLLGVGIYFLLAAKARGSALQEEINQSKATLDGFRGAPVYPSATNIAIAKAETEKLKGVLTDMKRFFTPVKAENVTGLAFRSWRDNTLADMRNQAKQARTTLPNTQYAFSFEAQKNKVDFLEGTFPAIPQQLAEVKAFSQILFEAHVDPLINIRRARVSLDDNASPVATDYLAQKIETNAVSGMVTSPYEFTFHCLSSELAAVLEGLIKSPHGLVVKALHIEPAEAAGPGGPNINLPPPPQPPDRNNPNRIRGVPPAAPVAPKPAAPGAAFPGAKPAGTGGSVVLLKERRLKVTMLVHVIKATK